MKIAIYGDSYGDIEYPNHIKTFPYLNKSWIVQLKQKHEVVNYARSGTGCEWSYNLITDHEKSGMLVDVDKIIFLVADPHRQYIYADYQITKDNLDHVRPSYDNKFAKIPKIWKAYKNFLKFFGDKQIFSNRAETIAGNLKMQYSNDILVLYSSAFTDVNKFNYQDGLITLTDVALKSMQFFSKKYKLQYRNIDPRFMHHISTENNIMLFDKFSRWIETGEFSLVEEDVIMLTENSPEARFLLKNNQRQKSL